MYFCRYDQSDEHNQVLQWHGENKIPLKGPSSTWIQPGPRLAGSIVFIGFCSRLPCVVDIIKNNQLKKECLSSQHVLEFC